MKNFTLVFGFNIVTGKSSFFIKERLSPLILTDLETITYADNSPKPSRILLESYS